MNIKIILSICLLSLIFALAACKEVTSDEAVEITKDFVNSQVKFFVDSGDSMPTVNRAQITIEDIKKLEYKVGGKNIPSWNIFLNIKSNQTGELKQANLLVIVDAKKGEILNWGKI